MKSRTSFFNPTVFKKNLTRFAPVWGLYTVAHLMALMLMADSGLDHWLHDNIAESIQLVPVVNLAYALLCTQLLFGDLYNSRMCNALHAMPIRREGWFLTNVASGLVFSLLPTAIMTLAALLLTPFSDMINGWQIPLYWMLGTNLQFLCFFGIALFSAFCVGNRFAQAMVYGIVNFASIIAYWLVDTLYTPLIYGVRTLTEPFVRFSPVVAMMEEPYIYSEQIAESVAYDQDGYPIYNYFGQFTLSDNWWYLWVCAAIGIALMIIALQMYRKRKLECAGDFMAVRGLEPVFLVAYTLVVGTLFQFVVDDIFGMTELPVFLFFGLMVGWFTGKMLLERSVRVFGKKSWLGCFAVMAAFGLTLVVALLEPFGIETWIPEAEEVESVTVSTSHGSYIRTGITLEDAEDIEAILDIHQEAITERIDEISWITVAENGGDVREMISITLTYQLKNGDTRSRYYYVWAEEGGGLVLEDYFTTVEAVFGTENPDLDALARGSEAGISYYSTGLMEALEDADIRGLLDAVVADCEAGTMAQQYAYHRNAVDLLNLSLGTEIIESDGGITFTYFTDITIYSDNENCVAWLEAQGVDVDAVIEEMYG